MTIIRERVGSHADAQVVRVQSGIHRDQEEGSRGTWPTVGHCFGTRSTPSGGSSGSDAATSVGRSWLSLRTRKDQEEEDLMKLRNLGVLGAAGVLAVTAVVPAFAQDKGELKIGIELPLSGAVGRQR